MRSETEMMELILEGARQDQRVIAAYLKGSRTNPNVPKDPYAMAVYHTQARPMLEQMLEWYVGCETGFSLSCGKRTAFFSNICRRNCTRPSLTPMPPEASRRSRTAPAVPGSSSARRLCWWPTGCPFPIRTGRRRAFCGTSS